MLWPLGKSKPPAMNAFRHSRPAMVWLLLVVALLVRAGVPTGWMPMADGEGGVRIMLCSGTAAVELAPPETAHPPEHAQHAHGAHASDHGSSHHGGDTHEDMPHDPCPYGLALAFALDAQAPVLVDFRFAPNALDGAMPAAVRLAIRNTLRPPARAPPAIA